MSSNTSPANRYPNHYKKVTTTRGGVDILIRPVKPEDAPLMVAFFNTLSVQSIYDRFFSHLKLLKPKMLAEFTQIDYDRDTALVAFDKNLPEEKMLGVARIVAEPGGTQGEFAVTVSDSWQGKGIGAALMEQLIDIAHERKMESLWAPILAENTHMLALARKLGFHISWNLDAKWYDLSLSLKEGS